jgi:hypothetical protein
MKNKPVFVFGYPSYLGLDGVFPIRTISECKNAIEEIKDGYNIDKVKLLDYIKALENAPNSLTYISEDYTELQIADVQSGVLELIIRRNGKS